MPQTFLGFVIAAIAAGCAYDTRFNDCAVNCTTDTGCPDGLTCGTEGLCRTSKASARCFAIMDGSPSMSVSPSCTNLAPTCGPNGSDDCCSTALPIPGGTYYRSYDVASDAMYPDMSYPATVSPFLLDKYEVTVGRFRAFVEAGGGTLTNPPAAGSAERSLNGMPNQGGWDPSWDVSLTTDSAAFGSALKCDATRQSWTDTPGTNEELPINCITWYEAFAFCAWDGGFLPTEAEWNYAAAGGDEQRAYPWSSPPSSLAIDCSYANYNGGSACVNPPNGMVNRVGSESPTGDSKWGHADLAGDIWEWTIDQYGSYETPCSDCANLMTGSSRSMRGGHFGDTALFLRTSFRNYVEQIDPRYSTNSRRYSVGMRCARPLDSIVRRDAI